MELFSFSLLLHKITLKDIIMKYLLNTSVYSILKELTQMKLCAKSLPSSWHTLQQYQNYCIFWCCVASQMMNLCYCIKLLWKMMIICIAYYLQVCTVFYKNWYRWNCVPKVSHDPDTLQQYQNKHFFLMLCSISDD